MSDEIPEEYECDEYFGPEIPSLSLKLELGFGADMTIEMLLNDEKYDKKYYEVFTVDNIDDAVKEFKDLLLVLKDKVENGKFESSSEEIFDGLYEMIGKKKK